MNAGDVMVKLKIRFDDPKPVIVGHALIAYEEYLALKLMMDELGELRNFMENNS